jgi:hypothetical protein
MIWKKVMKHITLHLEARGQELYKAAVFSRRSSKINQCSQTMHGLLMHLSQHTSTPDKYK